MFAILLRTKVAFMGVVKYLLLLSTTTGKWAAYKIQLNIGYHGTKMLNKIIQQTLLRVFDSESD